MPGGFGCLCDGGGERRASREILGPVARVQSLGELAPVVEPRVEDLLRAELVHLLTLARGTDRPAASLLHVGQQAEREAG